MGTFYELHEPPEVDSVEVLNDKAWRKEQLRRLWILIGMAFTNEHGPGKGWRMLKCYQILRKRLWGLSTCDWISLLAGFSDTQIYGKTRNPGLKSDLWRIRNTAAYICKSWNKDVI